MNWLPDRQLQNLQQAMGQPDLEGTRYRIVGTLGRGGMATVYDAFDRELGRQVALKVLDLPDAGGELAERMLREARVVARLEHPGIVPIHDVGVLPDGRAFYAMKRVKGQRLDQLLNTTLNERLRHFQKICEAVAFAHANGIIHRDLKPENIMVGGFGEVLVMDWGLAKVLREPSSETGPAEQNPETEPSLTSHGAVMGTPSYMAPEQRSGSTETLNERTDVYALGAILYFLLTGEAPFGTEPSAREMKPPRTIRPDVSRALEAICLKAMAENPERRYSGAIELGDDVARHINGLSVSAYRENPFEAMQRWLSRHYFAVLLILSYLILRVLLLLFRR